MTGLRKAVAFSLAATVLSGGMMFAQDHHDDHHDDHNQGPRDNHDNHGYVRHNDWKKGHRMDNNDWGRGERIDYRTHHLRTPPRGYEWRQVDGNYVMAAVATGLIASVIAASAAH